ncbi:MAG: hypothetical protein H7A34_07930 [bacterium]|nr:hypothetical protein [bacterium]
MPNLWQLDFTVNDIGGGVESLTFDLTFFNANMTFNSQLNPSSVFYELSFIAQNAGVLIPFIDSTPSTLPVPVGMEFNFFFNHPSSELPNPPDLTQ